jgi:hypothetical protein
MRIPDCFMHQLRNEEHIVNDLPTGVERLVLAQAVSKRMALRLG